MKKYTFFLGLNDKNSKWQIVDTNEALDRVMELVANVLGGGSVSLVKGVFTHENGAIVKENTIKIETLGFLSDNDYKVFAQSLRDYYNQESVLMEVSDVDAQFI